MLYTFSLEVDIESEDAGQADTFIEYALYDSWDSPTVKSVRVLDIKEAV